MIRTTQEINISDLCVFFFLPFRQEQTLLYKDTLLFVFSSNHIHIAQLGLGSLT